MMMCFRIQSLLLAFASLTTFAQKIEYTLSIAGDTTQNYHITVFPKEAPRGAIVMLPGFGELPRQTLIESDLYKHAANAGLITIIPALGDRLFFYIDDKSHQRLNKFIEEIFKKYQLDEKSFYIGGHSFGGTMAMQYAERAWSEQSKLKRPAAVFALDPPLDLERLYNCMMTTNRPNKNPISIQEDSYVSNRIQQEFKANPKDNPQFFWKVSPFAQSDPDHASIKPLKNVPVRVYNDPDINWYIENRSVDYYCINALDSAAMINWLRAMGNKEAELITATGKGHRVRQNIRHPHSWSIADGRELVAWMVASSRKN
jgi:pimeloyl-ACP methyl ester carboxylesterase